MTNETTRTRPSVTTWALIGVCVVGLIVALALFAMTNANMFATYDLNSGTFYGGPSPWVATIPLAVGVIAGIGVAITWTIERR